VPKISILKLVLNWAPQVDFHREQEKYCKNNPTADGHHLVEDNVLPPHVVIFVAKEGSSWVVQVERNVRDEHPRNKGQICIESNLRIKGSSLEVIGEVVD
jgi:hypothetical protein